MSGGAHTVIKLCGLTKPEDVRTANRLMPDMIGFVFWAKSRRNLTPEAARELKKLLDPSIRAVGVFVDEDPTLVADYLSAGIIDAAQLHGREDEHYIARLRSLTDKPLFKAFRVTCAEDLDAAARSTADMILLDSGKGTGQVFDWSLLSRMERPYLLAGGLSPENAGEAMDRLHPYGLDVSSGIETGGVKDADKMKKFVDTVRRKDAQT